MPVQSPEYILSQSAHRPWPFPNKPWVMAQSWHNLLFAHWSFPPETIQALIPAGLTLDTFDGRAWVGVVPFYMRNIRLRGLPPVAYTSAFAELNVRTYVTRDDKPGVWFFSLDASNRIGVEVARTFFHLPYFMTDMRLTRHERTIDYFSHRVDRRTGDGDFIGSYHPVSEVYLSEPGTLDHWLTERYCLYSQRRDGALFRGEIQHVPWPLQRAEAEIKRNTVTEAHDIRLPNDAPLLHYVEQLDIIAWYLERLN